MTAKRSEHLRHTLTQFDRVGADLQAALVKAEDALTKQEDREQRRAIRSGGNGDHPLREAGI